MQINPLVKKYWQNVTELYNAAYNNYKQDEARNAMNKLNDFSKIGKLFFELILTKLSLSIGNDQDILFNYLDKELCLSGFRVEYFLGFVLCEELENIPGFGGLEKAIQKGINEVGGRSKISTLDIDIEEETKKPSQIKYVEKATDKQKSEINFEDSDLDISLDGIQADNSVSLMDLTLDDIGGSEYNSDVLVKEIPQIQEYLTKLPKATSELSYLCQHMKWHQPIFEEKRSPISDGIYLATVEVVVKLKSECFKMSSECEGAISKKEARRVASLLLLRKIYNKFPDVWKNFSYIRQKNQGLQQNLNANNQEIFVKFKRSRMNLGIFDQKEKEKEDKIEMYLSSLKSYKAEINLLSGKQKKLSAPTMTKEPQDELGLWPVICEISYDSELFVAKAKETNKKKAEEKCSREILSQIYHKYPKLFESFVKHKEHKGI